MMQLANGRGLVSMIDWGNENKKNENQEKILFYSYK